MAQIRADLKAIAPYTRMVRTYSATNGAEAVPAIAGEFGLRVSLGAWIDKNDERNARELRAVIELARQNRNIDSIVVGNETIYRGEQIPLKNLGLNAEDEANLLQEEARRISEARTPERIESAPRLGPTVRSSEYSIGAGSAPERKVSARSSP